MKLIYKLERKFGHLAVKNLSLVLIICYGVGYVLQMIAPNVLYFLTLDPYAIAHGQVWRLVSWILVPPPVGNILFLVIMLMFYYSIGTSLEQAWGKFQYNLYLFSGFVCTVIGSFLMMGYCYLFRGDELALISDAMYFRNLSFVFSTYYVNMSIFLAYATTFPEHKVLLMFFIPVKMKWMAIVYVASLGLEIFSALTGSQFGFVYPFAIGSSLFNFIVFFFSTRNYVIKNKSQRNFNHNMKCAQKEERRASYTGATIHKCALCGRTEKDGDDLSFRYCSKCNGNYEFCNEHLYTHIHKE